MRMRLFFYRRQGYNLVPFGSLWKHKNAVRACVHLAFAALTSMSIEFSDFITCRDSTKSVFSRVFFFVFLVYLEYWSSLKCRSSVAKCQSCPFWNVVATMEEDSASPDRSAPRLDMSHGFMNHIRRNQQDRDMYDKEQRAQSMAVRVNKQMQRPSNRDKRPERQM